MNKLILFVVLVVSNIGLVNASNTELDIRFRSVIYFFPGAKAVDVSLVKAHLTKFELVDELPDSADKPLVTIKVIKDVAQSYPVPDAQYLAYFGRGLTSQQVASINKSQLALVVDVAYPYRNALLGLLQFNTSILSYLQTVDALIWDSETRELFTKAAWKEHRVASWNEVTPKIADHTVIHAYQDDSGVRAITLGMVKFGLPDIVVNDFSWSLNRSIGNLINLAAQSLLEGSRPNEQGQLVIKIADLKNAEFRSEMTDSLKENAVGEVSILVGSGEWEEGDPENYILELLFDNVAGTSLSEKQQLVLSNLFGFEENITYVRHNELILEASKRAKLKLPNLKEDFNKGLNPGEFIQVKAPFATPDGGNEWMWVEVLSWQGAEIVGLLKNEPFNIPTLKGGAQVSVKQDDIFDYIRHFSDGTSEGNETGILISKYQN